MRTLNRSLMFSYFPVWIASFLLPIYCTDLGLSPLETTGMFSVCSLFILLSKLISGKMCDRIGTKPVFVSGIFVMAVSYLVLAFAQNMVLLYLSQVLNGIGTALLAVSTYAMLANKGKEEMAVNRGKQASAENRGGLYGLILYFAAFARLDFLTGWKFFFLACAAFAFAAVWIAAKGMGNDIGELSSQKESVRSLLTAEKMCIILARFSFAMAENVLGAVFVLVMIQRFGENMMAIGLVCLIPSCLLTWQMPSIGAKVKRYGEQRSFLTAGLLAIGFLIWMTQSETTFLFGIGWCGYSFAVTAMRLAVDSLFSRCMGEQEKGALSGIYSCSINLGAMIAAVLGGFLLQTFGMSVPFYITALLIMVTVFLFGLKKQTANCRFS